MDIAGMCIVAVGSLSEIRIRPADVLKPALLMNAHGIVLGHNHPSGAVEPSAADIVVTRTLAEAVNFVGIELLDHVIVTAGGGSTSILEHSGRAAGLERHRD